MTDRQLDLFSSGSRQANDEPPPSPSRASIAAASDLNDAALLAAIPAASVADAPALAGEAARRKSAAAVPALEGLCRRFIGFGADRAVPEQVAALDALAVIGGRAARQAVERILCRHVVQGPALVAALAAAARLDAALPCDLVVRHLRHGDPRVRAGACRCVGPASAVVPAILDLMNDADPDVRLAATCALARIGRPEARPALVRLLRDTPSAEVVDAATLVADEDCMVLLGRIARTVPDLKDPALEALEALDHPRATQILAGLRTAGIR